MKKIYILLLAALMLVGCSSQSKEETNIDDTSSSNIVLTIEEQKKVALDTAQSYSDTSQYSREKVYITLLEDSSLSEEAVQYAMNNIDADWNQNALTRAKIYNKIIKEENKILQILQKKDLFTKEESEYAVSNLMQQTPQQ